MTYHARLMACRYNQNPGVNFSENYSYLVNNIAYRILLFLMIIYGYEATIVGVETVFLYGDLKEETHMECHSGRDKKGVEILVKQYLF